jgi:hypothetical protein
MLLFAFFLDLNDFTYSNIFNILENIFKIFLVLFFDHDLFKGNIDSPSIIYKKK